MHDQALKDEIEDQESDKGSFCDWDSVHEDEPVICLLADPTAESATKYDAGSDAWDTLIQESGVDVLSVASEGKWDGMKLVMIINYLRRHAVDAAQQSKSVKDEIVRLVQKPDFLTNEAEWNDEKYLIPTVENDSLLMYVLGLFADEDGWSDSEDNSPPLDAVAS